jgi:transcriptional regulator with XRE-family HTH domain
MNEPAKANEVPKTRRTHDELVAEVMKRPGVRAAYEEAQQNLAFFAECVKARKRAGMTQEDVAKRMGTSIAAVSRMETAGDRNYKPSPSVATLQRYAAALGCKLVLRLEPIKPLRPGPAEESSTPCSDDGATKWTHNF